MVKHGYNSRGDCIEHKFIASTVCIAEDGKNANCRIIINPDWTIEEDGKQAQVILTTRMRTEKCTVYRLDPDRYRSIFEDEPEVEESDAGSEYSGERARYIGVLRPSEMK